MTHLDRLLSRINAVLDGDSQGYEIRILAAEYAAAFESVRERLRQCATLVGIGSDYPALQVVETHPAALDIAAKLAFARSDQWIEHCRANGLPFPARIEDRLIEIANGLYAKEIGEAHPLYRDYRTAAREHDDRRALAILRSITKINPGDATARVEYAKTAMRVRNAVLKKIALHLEDGDAKALLSATAEMESVGLAPCHEEEVWRHAEIRLAEHNRALALEEANLLMPEIAKRTEAGDFAVAIPLLGKVRALQKRHGFAWPEGVENTIIESEQTVAKLEAFALEKIANEGACVEALATFAEIAAKPRDENTADDALLKRVKDWLAKSAPVSAYIPEEFALAKKIAGELAYAGAKRTRALFSKIAICSATVIVAGAILAFVFSRMAERADFVAALEHAETATTAEPVKKFFDGPGKDVSDEFIARAQTLRARFDAFSKDREHIDTELKAVEAMNDADLTEAVSARVAALAATAEKLPEDWRKTEGERVALALRKVDETRLAGPTDALEKIVAASADGSTDETMKTAKAALKAALATTTAAGPVAAGRANDAIASAERAAERAQKRAAESTKLAEAEAALGKTGTLAEYLAALSTIAEISPLSDTGRAASRIVNATSSFASFPVALLTEEQELMRRSLKENGEKDPFVSATPVAAETAVAAAFAPFAKYVGFWAADFVNYESDGTFVSKPVVLTSRPTIENSDLNGGQEIRTRAVQFSPAGGIELSLKLIRFNGRFPVGKILENARNCPESPAIEKLSTFHDIDKSLFTASALETMDTVVSSGASPLLKAWAQLRLAEIIDAHPTAWGVAFSPEFRIDTARLRAVAPATLPADAWIYPEKHSGTLSILRNFYGVKRGPYTPLATARANGMRAALAAGLKLVGRAGADGAPSFIESALTPGDKIFGVSAAGDAKVLGTVGADGKPKLDGSLDPFTPLVKIVLDPEKAIRDEVEKLSPEKP